MAISISMSISTSTCIIAPTATLTLIHTYIYKIEENHDPRIPFREARSAYHLPYLTLPYLTFPTHQFARDEKPLQNYLDPKGI